MRMQVNYELFKREVVEVGDLYFSPVGGFAIQFTKVFRVDRKGFNYRNEKYVSRFEFEYDNGKRKMLETPLDGIIVKQKEGSLVFYVNANFLKQMGKIEER